MIEKCNFIESAIKRLETIPCSLNTPEEFKMFEKLMNDYKEEQAKLRKQLELDTQTEENTK